jgi:hypothetical protein
LKLGQALSVETFDPPIFASLCNPNLNTVLKRLAEYNRLIGPIHMSVKIGKRQTCVTLECDGYNGKIPRSLGAMELVFFNLLARLATCKRTIPSDLVPPQLPDNPNIQIHFLTNPQDI